MTHELGPLEPLTQAQQDRIESRNAAREAWSLVQSVAEDTPDPAAFWNQLIQLQAAELLPKPSVKVIEPMTAAEARHFEMSNIPPGFGRYGGLRIDTVPLSYLCRLSDPSPFIERVRRYLKNPEVRRRIDEECD